MSLSKYQIQQSTKWFGKKLARLNATATFVWLLSFLFSARHYKFGDINNNELLIINLTAVRAGVCHEKQHFGDCFVIV